MSVRFYAFFLTENDKKYRFELVSFLWGGINLKSQRIITKRISVLILVMVFFFVYFCAKSYAYIDPGTGSYMLQLIIGALLGIGFYIRSSWKKIFQLGKNLFARKKQPNKLL
jgi:Na+-translocating ferredoxin:NAD+ oxidoreductase RnfD subunit